MNTTKSGGDGAVVAKPTSRHPIELVREAVLNQRAAGVYVRIGALGVHCTSQEPPTWGCDPREKGVSPLGATLLEHPYAPPIDPHEALALLFDCPVAFVDGLSDGMDRSEPDMGMVGKPDARAYIGGWEIGYRFREEFLRASVRS
ncbi:MAG TPA: hypothetical protein VHG72_13875 [Polyangia bacterium]|nr:hypothetical protein [Polyangia bacterium]